MLKLCWFLKILICVICGIVPSQFTVHLTMLCKETALEQGGDPLGERLCAVRAVLWNGVGTRGLTSIRKFAAGFKTARL